MDMSNRRKYTPLRVDDQSEAAVGCRNFQFAHFAYSSPFAVEDFAKTLREFGNQSV